MLEAAARKAGRFALGNRISFVFGDAAELPFQDSYFDCIGISFAFRNLTYRNPMAKCYLAEALRILTPGGRFVIVETSQPQSKIVRKLFHLYLYWFVYRVGRLISCNRVAYRYMVTSVARFFSPKDLRKMLLRAGFRQVFFRSFLLGVVSIHIAVR